MKIKEFKMRVNSEQSKKVQEVLFKNGYSWNVGQTEAINTESKFLYFIDGSLFHGKFKQGYGNHFNTKLTFEQFIKKYDK